MLTRKLFRTMWIYKAQFLSMIIMTILGIGIFVGFNVEWYSIDQNTSRFMEETGYADYRVISEEGFSEEEVHAIEKIYGTDEVTRYTSLKVQVKNEGECEGDYLSLTTVENENISGFLVEEGEAYSATEEDGIWISDKYARTNGIALEDELELAANGIAINTTVKGFIYSSEDMICIQSETQIMPDYELYGYAYISPKMFEKNFGGVFYPQIHVVTDVEKAEFTAEVNEALGVTSMILTKDQHRSYMGSQGEIEEGKVMGSILPVLFLLIAVLTMVTTMHRIANKEQVQIGTLKALGFKNRKILIHYTLYALIIGGLGSVFGAVLGYGLAYMIFNPEGSMATYLDMPYWNLYMPDFGYAVLIGTVILLVVIGLLSVYRILQGTAAEILRPTQGGKIKPLKIERTKWFHKRSFGMRWNLRDALHHKARTAMSLIGVIGCMIILLASLGMYDTMNRFLDTYYNGAMQYTSRIYIADEVTDTQVQELTDLYGEETSATLGVEIEEHAVALDVYHLEEDLVRFVAEDGSYETIGDEGAYICKRIANEYELKVGDSFVISPYGQDEEYTLKVGGVLSSITENIVISQAYADELEMDYVMNSIYTNEEDIPSQDSIKDVQSKQELVESFDVMVEIMDTMIIMLVAIGLILSIVVLYNLGIMGYTERYREMATLKVLGFRDKKISALLISQNLWLSFVGILLGIPIGYLTLNYLLTSMAGEYEMNLYVSPKTYVISIALNVGVSLLVSIMVSRKNKHIDMVEALKSVE